MEAKTLTLFWLLFCVGTSFSEDAATKCATCEDSYKRAVDDNTFEIRELDLPDGMCTNDTAYLISTPDRCCSDSCQCKYVHGSECRHNYLYDNNLIRCDYFLPDSCPNQHCCGCCLNCNVRICSDCLRKEGATCRRTCQWNEYPISVQCHSPYCQCCRKCEMESSCQASGGRCVGHPSFCRSGYYLSKRGCNGDCYCCYPPVQHTGYIDKTA